MSFVFIEMKFLKNICNAKVSIAMLTLVRALKKPYEIANYFSKLVIHLDTSIYDENSAEKLEAEWKDGKMEYKEIIIAPSASKRSRKYWKIIQNTKMQQKGINH